MCPSAVGDARRNALGLGRSRQGSAHTHNCAATARPERSEEAPASVRTTGARIRVYISAEDQPVREMLCCVLGKFETIRVMPAQCDEAFEVARLAKESADVVLLISQGRVQEELERVSEIRGRAPEVKILLFSSAKEDSEFLQYVRAGISGYLWRDASAEDVAHAIENVHAGKAVCPGELCAALFKFFEDAEPRLPVGSPRQRLGLTRREQQIVPLIAKGLTNKEIANHFCLSEQTVKNHLYRMKHKIGVEDRLSIVQKFRTQGFPL